jgi:hypothetical protein
MNTLRRIDPRIRALGKARLDVTQRAASLEEWQKNWREPRYPFPFRWTNSWKASLSYRVDDYAAELGFWLDVIGLPVSAMSLHSATFTSPNQDFFFTVLAAEEGRPATPPEAFRLQFQVADLCGLADLLRLRGVRFEQEPLAAGEVDPGLGWAVFQTPHGLPVELWGYAEGLPSAPPEPAPPAEADHPALQPKQPAAAGGGVAGILQRALDASSQQARRLRLPDLNPLLNILRPPRERIVEYEDDQPAPPAAETPAAQFSRESGAPFTGEQQPGVPGSGEFEASTSEPDEAEEALQPEAAPAYVPQPVEPALAGDMSLSEAMALMETRPERPENSPSPRPRLAHSRPASSGNSLSTPLPVSTVQPPGGQAPRPIAPAQAAPAAPPAAPVRPHRPLAEKRQPPPEELFFDEPVYEDLDDSADMPGVPARSADQPAPASLGRAAPMRLETPALPTLAYPRSRAEQDAPAGAGRAALSARDEDPPARPLPPYPRGPVEPPPLPEPAPAKPGQRRPAAAAADELTSTGAAVDALPTPTARRSRSNPSSTRLNAPSAPARPGVQPLAQPAKRGATRAKTQ